MDPSQVVSDIVEGVDLKSLTLSKAAWTVALILVGAVAIKIVLKLVDRAMSRSKAIHPIRGYLRSALRVVLWIVLIIIAAGSLGVEMTSLVALLSVAALAISLAMQNTLSNLAGGIMVLVSKPFAPGDYIETDGVSGSVLESGLAYTTIATIDNKEIFIPNSQIAAAKIVNYTALGRRRVDLNFTASYDAPTQAVKDATREVLDGIPQIQPDPAPEIWLTEYKSSSIQYVVRAWTASTDYWTVYFAIQEGVRESFARHGVEMTYDHLNVHLVEKGRETIG